MHGPQVRRTIRRVRLAACIAVASVFEPGTAIVYAGNEAAAPEVTSTHYSPQIQEPVTNLYWGDTHLHTQLSADAYILGTRATADQAYRFARGSTVIVDNGMPVRLRRPLDFLAVTDHAEYMGIYERLAAGDDALRDWAVGQRWAALLAREENNTLGIAFANAIQSKDPEYRVNDNIRRNIWQEAAKVADRYNEPGLFTAFVGYEWTSMVSGDNLHRVVLYRDDSALAAQKLPFTAQHSTDPEDLWTALAEYEQETGGQVMAIAHNGNVSNGRMFSPMRENGEPIGSDYVSRRIRWEPVYEVTQVKGDGETHPYLSPDDEFADFETWDEGNISLTAEKEDRMLQYEYARSAFREGLRHEAALGSNPFKFGLIGSTDSHTAVSTVREDNFFGKFLESEPDPERSGRKMAGVLQESWQLGASGLAAVWAAENTREALFDAMKRREVYATTGPRIKLRFFGGWTFEQHQLASPDYERLGYRNGVPMGGDLVGASAGSTPSFMIVAAKDPDGANLDRVQVVKGWLHADGKTHEKIHNVALSDGRQVESETGKAPSVGSSVDVERASFTNSIGAAELATVWHDPDFNPDEPAFYYVRVLEIPTPRWTTYDARYFQIQAPEDAPMTVQDRAYSSPIWYTP